MKIRIILILLLLCLALLTSCDQVGSAVDYFYQINSMVCKIDFHTGEVRNGVILLYDADGKIILELPFEKYDKEIRLIEIRKAGNIVYFVTGRAIDDEDGIFFINDDTNDLFNGIASLDRVGGNSYQYSTAPK